jgi:iron complex outermembrane receptor protein
MFSFEDLPHGSHRVVFRLVGYQDATARLDPSGDVPRTIRLVPKAIDIPGVTIIGKNRQDDLTGSSRSVALLTPAELDRHRGQTLGSTLEQIPGITLLQTGPSIAKPVVRGLHSQRVLILNAGLPQEGQQWGGEHAPEIDPFGPSRIEVLKGAAGVEYGAGAIGGVIRVEPRGLKDTPGIDGELILNGFSNNRQGSGAGMLEGGIAGVTGLGWRLQGSYRKAGDSRSARYVLGNTGFTELNASGALGYSSDAMSIEAYFSHFGTELGIFLGSHIGNTTDLLRAIALGPSSTYDFTYDIRPPKQKITHDLFSVKASEHFSNLGTLDLQLGYQQNSRLEFDAHKPYNDSLAALNRPAFDLTLTTYTFDAKFTHQPISNLFGKFGISGMRQGNVRAGSVYLVPNFRAYSGGVYVFENWTEGAWSVNGGIRYDYKWIKVYPIDFKNIQLRVHEYKSTSVAIGSVYRLADEWSIGANIGAASRAPSINELYSNDVHHGTAQFEIGSIDLEVERSYSADATLKHAGSTSKAELSVYNNFMKNFIFPFPDPNPTLTIRGAFPTFRYMQADAVLRGCDGMVEYRALDRLRLRATFTIVRGDNLDTHEPLIAMPADRVRFIGHYDLGDFSTFSNIYLECTATLIGKQNRVPMNADYASPPSGYALFDAGVGSELGIGAQDIIIDVSVQNIFDSAYRDYMSRYRYFVDDPGINAVLRVRIPFGPHGEQ